MLLLVCAWARITPCLIGAAARLQHSLVVIPAIHQVNACDTSHSTKQIISTTNFNTVRLEHDVARLNLPLRLPGLSLLSIPPSCRRPQLDISDNCNTKGPPRAAEHNAKPLTNRVEPNSCPEVL